MEYNSTQMYYHDFHTFSLQYFYNTFVINLRIIGSNMRIFNSEIVLGFTFQVVPQPKITSTKVAEAIEITKTGS